MSKPHGKKKKGIVAAVTSPEVPEQKKLHLPIHSERVCLYDAAVRRAHLLYERFESPERSINGP